MNNNFFSITKFGIFDTFFQDDQHPWECVGKIEKHLVELFENKTINENYGEKIFVDPSAKIDKQAKIIGPAYIGKGAIIGFGAYVRENVIVLDQSYIGHASSVKNSIILKSSAAPHNNYIGDSVIGSGVNFGAGSIIANWRFDEKNVLVKIENEIIDTGREKFGAIIGDNTKVGSNAVINPGSIVESDCFIFPLASVKGHHLNGSHIH